MHLLRRLLPLTLLIVVRAGAASCPAPDFPDPAHVPNGCYLSSTCYLARFRAAWPAEKGQTLALAIRNDDGTVQPHTVALVTWQGAWWARDEYFGTFAVGRSASAAASGLTAAVQTALVRHAEAKLREGVCQPEPASHRANADRLRREVAAARDLIGPSAQVFMVRCAGRETPFLFFRPSPGAIAVYEPSYGTAAAQCRATDAAKIIAAVATRMGFAVQSVRPALPFDLAAGLAVAAR